jgi:hypothetical protein
MTGSLLFSYFVSSLLPFGFLLKILIRYLGEFAFSVDWYLVDGLNWARESWYAHTWNFFSAPR